MQFVFLYQREPHAGEMAFRDAQQPVDLGERVELARRTCDDLSLPAAATWIDGMDDRSRALFDDLPSPAIVIDPFGTVRLKQPWAEPDQLEPQLAELLAALPNEVQAALKVPSGDGPAAAAEADANRRRGAQLWQLRRGVPPTAPVPDDDHWAAASGVLRDDGQLAGADRWLRLVAAANLLAERPADPRAPQWLTLLTQAEEPAVRHWALQRALARAGEAGDAARTAATGVVGEARLDADGLRRALDRLRRAEPWLVGKPR